MQRLTARFLLLFALAGTFVPLTLAAVAPPPHSCCLRKAAHHCHGAETADRSIRNTSCCNQGSGRAATTKHSAPPSPSLISDFAPPLDSHLTASNPAAPAQQLFSTRSPRAPPQSSLA